MEFIDWGLIDYEQALTQQLELLETVAKDQSSGFLVFCSHPAIVTLGRNTKPDDLFAWAGPVKEISRGGRATYHGPSQLVVYPIFNMNYLAGSFPKKDIAWYLRNLEGSIVETLKQYSVEAVGKSLQKKSMTENESEETGVWVGHRKIASLGIAIRKWISFHGAAINLDEDPEAFAGMNPCGFKKEVMISLENILKRPVNREEFKLRLKNSLLQKLQ